MGNFHVQLVRRIGACALVGSCVTAFAQIGAVPMPKVSAPKETGPTLDESLRWIEQKVQETSIATYPGGGDFTNHRRDFVRFNQCQGEHITIQRNDSPGTYDGWARWEFTSRYLKFQIGELNGSNLNVSSMEDDHSHHLYHYISIGTIARREIVDSRQIDGTVSKENPNSNLFKEYRNLFDRALQGDVDAAWQVVAIPPLPKGYERNDKERSIGVIAVGDLDVARRLVNAFSHVIKLCAEEDAARRSATTIKPANEPF